MSSSQSIIVDRPMKKRKLSAFNASTKKIAAALKRDVLPDVCGGEEDQRALTCYLSNQAKNKARWAGREFVFCTIQSLDCGEDEIRTKLGIFFTAGRFTYTAIGRGGWWKGQCHEGRLYVVFSRGSANQARIKRDLAKTLGIDKEQVAITYGTEACAYQSTSHWAV